MVLKMKSEGSAVAVIARTVKLARGTVYAILKSDGVVG
jgi:hypothetical protein